MFETFKKKEAKLRYSGYSINSYTNCLWVIYRISGFQRDFFLIYFLTWNSVHSFPVFEWISRFLREKIVQKYFPEMGNQQLVKRIDIGLLEILIISFCA